LSFSFPTEVIREGVAEVVVPRLQAFVKTPSDYAPSKAPVFYNPVMELNRDFAVLALRAFQGVAQHGLQVCEPLAGCGIRGIRLAMEVEGVTGVVMNDINRTAYELAKFNVHQNAVAAKVIVKNDDANFLLSSFGAPRRRFDYIDIDPFGSPMPYVDCAVRALRKGGMLAVTATDLAPLCGVHPKPCVRKYGATPLRTEYCHELAVRLVAGALARSAARYDVSVTVLFSHSSEHYLRVYSVVDHGAKKANSSLRHLGYLYHCFACFHREQTTGLFECKRKACPECGHKMSIAGPLWLGSIADSTFVASMEKAATTRHLRQKQRIHKILSLVEQETEAPITYYVTDKICDKLGLRVPSMARVIAELKTAGYHVRPTHFNSRGVKTDAPAALIKDVVAGVS
jgi:tRNA (guanine26-N2/guanine27-N2)-dimethyltransferase